MSKAAQGFSLRRTDGTLQTAFSQAAGANPRRTPLIGKRAIYGWKLANGFCDRLKSLAMNKFGLEGCGALKAKEFLDQQHGVQYFRTDFRDRRVKQGCFSSKTGDVFFSYRYL